MWLQKLDPILSMGNYVMRPEHNSEPKYRIIMLTREEKTRRPGNPPAVKGPIWYREGSRMLGGEAVICRQSLGRTLSISLPTYAIVFQTYIYIYIYILFWSALKKPKLMLDQRNTSAFSQTVRWL